VGQGVPAPRVRGPEELRQAAAAVWGCPPRALTPPCLSPHLAARAARLTGRPFAPLQLDYGSTYASKFERLDDGRLVINTWVMDSFIGCVDSCSDNKPEGDAYVKK
jgi:hypothetical protein